MADQSRCYTSYLLRLWRPADSAETNWHASLENTQTSECKSFGSLDALLVFLQSEFGAGQLEAPAPPPREDRQMDARWKPAI